MMERLLTNWDAMRWLRLVIAMLFLFAGISRSDPFAYAAALFFGFQALWNVGCCGAACAPTQNSTDLKDEVRDVSFEEVK